MLYSPGDNRTYVGLTFGSALSRFEKHVQCARAGSNKLVHKWIANKGFRNVFVFALERVPILKRTESGDPQETVQ